MEVSVRKAKVSDIEAVSSVLTEAALYLESIEQPLWVYNDLVPTRIKDDIYEGLYFIAEVQNEPVGVFKYQLSDKIFWPEIKEGTSGFLHRVAIKRKFASKGISMQMLQWAKRHTKRIGRQFLRLDCAIRPKLCAVYESAGFTKHSDKNMGTFSVTRYECSVENCEQKH